jgi:putative proteasome-type protease
MTYCVGMMVDKGIVLMSDTRTNSGVDNISVFRKMFHWNIPGERIITVMTAGNLATTQAVVSKLEEWAKLPGDWTNPLMESSTMFQVATEIGALVRETIGERQAANGMTGKGKFTASIHCSGAHCRHGTAPVHGLS